MQRNGKKYKENQLVDNVILEPKFVDLKTQK